MDKVRLVGKVNKVRRAGKAPNLTWPEVVAPLRAAVHLIDGHPGQQPQFMRLL